MNRRYVIMVLLTIFLSACQQKSEVTEDVIPAADNFNSPSMITATPFQPNHIQPIQNNENSKTTVFVPDYLQKFFNLSVHTENYLQVSDASQSQCSIFPGNGDYYVGNLTFVVVRPFNSVQDGIPNDELKKILLSDEESDSGISVIYVDEFAYQVLKGFWGKFSSKVVAVSEEEIFDYVLEQPNSIGIFGFESIEPKWKVLKIDEISPLDKNFNHTNYLLDIPISINCVPNNDEGSIFFEDIGYFSNRDSEKLTIILMSGTTALTRATASRMETMGNTYPGEAMKNWFDQSDFRHVSSETPFFDGCPFPNPYQEDLSFCSRPDYIELFDYLGVNIVELTGNHLLDKGNQAFENTLSLFQDSGFKYFAGGYSIEEAQKPLLIEHNGNKVAFIGCNNAGPANAWAENGRSGVARCDFGFLKDQIQKLVQEGYLPIVTFQYFESNYTRPSQTQIRDFRSMIDAGAVIISGSQSHVPMTMEIYQNGFIHYGLGNLFFDQMDNMDNRREFLDRHVFYDGKYIGTEILTAKLEDYAKPIPMTKVERDALLFDVFRYFDFTQEDE